MSELFDHIDKLKKTEPAWPSPPSSIRGARRRARKAPRWSWARAAACSGSVTIGGCVDAQVIEQSADVLDQNVPRLLELDLGDEEAWEIGLTCGGTIEVFLEPVSLDKPGRRDARLLREGARPCRGRRPRRGHDPPRR